MPRSTFYYQLKHLNDEDKHAEEKEAIAQIFKENKGRYGYRRITMEMRNRVYFINHKTVRKLMHACGIKCEIRRHKYRSYKGSVGKVAPNIGEIVSYNISLHPVFHQVMDMLEKAFEKIPNTSETILHSDQGWQYQMKKYQHMLKEHDIIQSMSRKENCLDNSVMEIFFGLLKTEMFYKQEFKSTEHLISEIEAYIDYYNNRRIKCKLKGLSSVQYRIQSSRAA